MLASGLSFPPLALLYLVFALTPFLLSPNPLSGPSLVRPQSSRLGRGAALLPELLSLAFGPQHPAAHGLAKLQFAMDGDIVVRIVSEFGLLHRGTEKLAESRPYLQSVPYMDRLDYVANLIQEHVYVLALEALIGRQATPEVYLSRVLFDELSRVMNHLLTISAICLDMGAMGPIFWAFEEREYIMEIFERASGARMHTALYLPYGFASNLFSSDLMADLRALVDRGSRFITSSFLNLLSNRALKTRLSGVGLISSKKAQAYGLTGLISRASGIQGDLRSPSSPLCPPYSSSYSSLSFSSFISLGGDALDRFSLRAREGLESLSLVGATLKLIEPLLPTPTRGGRTYSTMEDVISHFRGATGVDALGRGQVLTFVEGPKGVVGAHLLGDSSQIPYRLKVRSPVAHNMNFFPDLGRGQTFGDAVASFCSLDIVLGEIDR